MNANADRAADRGSAVASRERVHDRKVVLVTRRTRLEELIARFHTIDQARFYVEHLGARFDDYEREHGAYLAARAAVLDVLQAHGRFQIVERGYLPNFLFGPDDVVVALGQDGLVANTMKYLASQPLVGLNPDPARYDGILLPFEARQFGGLLPAVLNDARDARRRAGGDHDADDQHPQDGEGVEQAQVEPKAAREDLDAPPVHRPVEEGEQEEGRPVERLHQVARRRADVHAADGRQRRQQCVLRRREAQAAEA